MIIQMFSLNSVVFLRELASWLITPVPFSFLVLAALCAIFRFLGGLIHG